MSEFENFLRLNSKKEDSIGKYAIQSVSSAVISAFAVNSVDISSSLIYGSGYKKDVEKFSTQVGDLVGSDEFVTELSAKIDVPLPNESEDDFVKRAKESMKQLMRAKLAGKS